MPVSVAAEPLAAARFERAASSSAFFFAAARLAAASCARLRAVADAELVPFVLAVRLVSAARFAAASSAGSLPDASCT